jgi:PKD repeat protein
MRNILLLFFLCTFIFSGCNKDEDDVADAVACFTMNTAEATDSTFTFLFDQCPPAYDVSYWDFGDGQYSSNPNPAHVFNHYGTYNVKLTVTNSVGHSSSVTHTIKIGHYSLDKIVYKKIWTYNSFPCYLDFYDTLLNVVIRDTLLSQSSLPLTHQLTDNPVYDLGSANMFYHADEHDITLQFHSADVSFSTSSISNNQLDFAFPYPPYDTAKFTLHFKFVPR